MKAEVRGMGHPRLSDDEIERRGKELYERQIRKKVETEENFGKIISIDVETGDYEIDQDLLKSAKRLLARHPEGALWSERIGYDAVIALGGAAIERISQ
jgi:hypothetical protein